MCYSRWSCRAAVEQRFVVLVRGAAGVDALRLLAAASEGDVARVSWCDGRWWVVEIDVPVPAVDQLVGALPEECAAAVFTRSAGGAVTVLLRSPGDAACEFELPFGDSSAAQADAAERIDTWSKVQQPPRRRKRSAVDAVGVLTPASDIGDFAIGVITALGWRPRHVPDSTPRLSFRMLGGCVNGRGPGSHRSWIGATRVNWDSTRWAAGHGTDFYGLWDRDNPDAPVERWPLTRDGYLLADQALFQREQHPLLAATTLMGTRSWARLADPTAPAAIVHLSPTLRMSVIPHMRPAGDPAAVRPSWRGGAQPTRSPGVRLSPRSDREEGGVAARLASRCRGHRSHRAPTPHGLGMAADRRRRAALAARDGRLGPSASGVTDCVPDRMARAGRMVAPAGEESDREGTETEPGVVGSARTGRTGRFAWAGWRRMRDSNSRGVAPNTLSESA
jgi:hypothetical protein